MGWTSQQEHAIKSIDRSIIVSAAAGSGKTAVLVERLTNQIRDINNPISADKIIVVTFTNDAATELRQRINAKLQLLIAEALENEKQFLMKQYILFQNAKISTINAFCFDIIRDNAENFDITSGFKVLEPAESLLLETEALDEAIQLWCETRKDDFNKLYEKFCINDNSNIKQVIFEITNFLASMPQRQLWLNNVELEFNKDFYDSVYYKKIKELWEDKLNLALKYAEENEKIISELYEGVSTEIESYRAETYAKNQRETLIIKKSIEKLNSRKNIVMEDFDSRLTFKGGKYINAVVKNKYTANRKIYKEIVSEYLSISDNIITDIKENAETFFLIKQLIEDFYSILWSKKVKKDALNFEDGERLLIDLLSDYDEKGRLVPSETAKTISKMYDIIMIDEYQDSNNKQDIIFKLISHNFKHNEKNEPMYGDNVFLVGDVKQSIYRFRLANPDNFISTFNVSTPYSPDQYSANSFVCLNKNFRSAPEVIDYINFVFEQIMSEKCGDIAYTDNEKLYFGASEYSEFDDSRKTQISIIDTDNETDQSSISEARVVAKQISDMIKNKTPVIKKSGTAPCKPSDFCILIRKNESATEFIDALKYYNIYAKGEEKAVYLDSREISIMLDILKIIDNPLLDIPLVAVLMSSMFVFTSQEIAEIKALYSNDKIYSAMIKIHQDENFELSPLIKTKCKNFIESLRILRIYSVTHSLESLIEKIYDTTDFLSVMQQSVDGEKKKANLRLLIQYAKAYEGNSSSDENNGLSGFLRYIERLRNSDSDLPQGKISASSDEYVSVKTIHKSKGLEYPFIFLTKINAPILMKNKDLSICSQDYEIGFKLYDPTIFRKIKTEPFTLINSENDVKFKSEAMRLLYVALTRAKQKLFINLTINDKTIQHIENLYDDFTKCNDLFSVASRSTHISDWIWLSFFNHEKIKEITEICGLNIQINNSKLINNDVFDICFYDSIEEKSTDELIEKTQILPDKNIVDEINQIINYKYDFTESQIPVKMTVTQINQITKNNSDEIIISTLNKPQFWYQESSKIEGTKRGNIIHTVFQHFDFNIDINEIHDEIQRLIDDNYITEYDAEIIPVDKLEIFLNSELCSRIKSAKTVIREKNFVVKVNELNYKNDRLNKFSSSDGMIIGIIDLIIEEDDGYVIVDYKSDRGSTENALKSKYTEQLILYKAALECISNKKVKELLLYSVELGKQIVIVD